jgi:hypothetical protein
MNPYIILNIDKRASNDDIRKAYIKLAMKYHPDKNKTKSKEIQQECEEKFKEINNAYNMLINGKVSDTHLDSKYSDIADRIFKEAKLFGKYFFDIVQDITEDIHVNLNIDIFDIYNNIEKQFTLSIKRKCKKCMGMGVNIIQKDYSTCMGCLGEKYKLMEITFKINAGEGRHIFFKKGHEEYGKRTGNVIINIHPKNLVDYKIINHFDLLLYIYDDNDNPNSFKHFDNKTYRISGELDYYKIYSFKNMGLLDYDMKRGTLFIQKIMEPFEYNTELELVQL